MADTPLSQQFVIALFNTRNRLRFAMDEAFRPLGITDATWRTLFYLEQTGGGVLQKELAEVMGIEQPSLVRLLDSLEAKQLIERRPSRSDRRAKTVHLTAKAEGLVDELHDVAASVRESLFAGVETHELAQCLATFERILAHKSTRTSEGQEKK